MAPLIETRGLRVGFRGASGAMLPVLRDIDLRVERGESLGIVGESGSGKSTLALAAMGYLRHGLQRISGTVRYDGQDMFALGPAALARIRGGQLGLIPQNSGQALTPTQRVGTQIAEALQLHCDLDPARITPGPATFWRRCACPSPRRSCAATRTSSRAGSNSASPSPWRSPESRTRCCSTSRPPGSTSRRRPISSHCCATWRGTGRWRWSA